MKLSRWMGRMTTYFEFPDEYNGTNPCVFLAGGITNCPDWQAEARNILSDIVVLNPRRASFSVDDRSSAHSQIEWEYRHLAHAARFGVILFWFPYSGIITQPIALYELGAHAAIGNKIAVGCSSRYVRRDDVVIQLGLCRPDVQVHATLTDTVQDVYRILKK